MEYKVKNFNYNGFYGKELVGLAGYTAEFKKWTNDPGIAVCQCSDGQERLIPTFALVGCKVKDLPEQSMKNKEIFGSPSHS